MIWFRPITFWLWCALVASAGLWHLGQRPNHIAGEVLTQPKYLLPFLAWGSLTLALWLGMFWRRRIEAFLGMFSGARWWILGGLFALSLWILPRWSLLQSLTYYLLIYLALLLLGIWLLILSTQPDLKRRMSPLLGYFVLGLLVAAFLWDGLVRAYPIGDSLETQKSVIGLFRSNPDFGWSLRPDYAFRWHNSDEFDNHVQINNLGQYDIDRQYERTDQQRVAVIGDSFIEALHIPLDQIPTQVAEKCLNQTEVLNLGISATGTGQQWLFYEQSAYRYQADVVILGMYLLNDFDDNYRTRNWLVSLHGAYSFNLDAAGGLQIRYVEPWRSGADWLADYSSFWRIRQAQNILRQSAPPAEIDYWYQDRLFRSDFTETSEWFLMMELLRRFKASVEAHDGELKVLLIPSKVEAIPLDELGTSLPEGLDVDFAHAAMLDFLTSDLEVEVLDFYPVIRASQAKSLYLEKDGHFNAAGYQLLGEFLCQFIQKDD